MTTKIEQFQPKNFVRLEWNGAELTCFGRKGNGEEEPWGAHEFVKGTPTRTFFDDLTKLLKLAKIEPFTALMGGYKK
jgi:hypothetical protein